MGRTHRIDKEKSEEIFSLIWRKNEVRVGFTRGLVKGRPHCQSTSDIYFAKLKEAMTFAPSHAAPSNTKHANRIRTNPR